MTNNQNIDKLLAKFYDASISQEEIDILFNYFLCTDPLPECYADDVDLIRGLAIMRYCRKTKTSFEKSLIEKERKIRNAFIYKKVKYGVAAAASVAILVLALWQVRTNSVLIPNTPEALQTSASVLVAQTTDTHIPNIQDHKPATITDNEIKNTANQTADAPQPDIMATTPIAQEPVSVLLAEIETQPEQNYTAIDNTNTLSTDTILQLQTDLPKYETSYLAYIDIQSYNAGNRIYFCNSDCTNKYMEEAVCEMINGI